MHDAIQQLEDVFHNTEDKCVIINLDSSDGRGTHWTAALTQNGVNYYFDSFGVAPSDEVARVLNISAYSDNRIQETKSNNCGLFCVYLLYQCMERGVPFEDVVSSGRYFIPFDSPKNEELLFSFLQ